VRDASHVQTVHENVLEPPITAAATQSADKEESKQVVAVDVEVKGESTEKKIDPPVVAAKEDKVDTFFDDFDAAFGSHNDVPILNLKKTLPEAKEDPKPVVSQTCQPET